ncbi:MAG: lipoprotein [Pseudomonadales bacterium]|nr:lipoprotein [Pseudomonadales bacterium]
MTISRRISAARSLFSLSFSAICFDGLSGSRILDHPLNPEPDYVRHTLLRLAILFFLGTLISAVTGCGQKGPLYLPREQPAEQQNRP